MKSTEFEGWDLSKKQRIAKRLRSVIKKSAFKGFALGVAKKDYDAAVPAQLRAQEGFQNHYTYAIRRVLGMIDTWRQQKHITDTPIQHLFDWLDRNDARRREIESVFDKATGEREAFRRYSLQVNGVHFKKKETASPLQAADILAWLTYQWVLNEQEQKKINPIAVASFSDLYLHKKKQFLEGGHQTKLI